MPGGILLFNIGFFFINNQHKFSADYFIGTLIIILGFIFATIQNDIEDLEIDKINSPDKAIASGRLNVKEISDLSIAILAILLGLSLYHFPNHLFFVIPMLGMIWFYNKRPLVLSRRPISSIMTLALIYSVFPLIYGYYLNNGLKNDNYFLFLIAFWFLVRISVAILKDYKDVKGDKIYNKKTFYLVFGNKYTIWVSVLFFCFGSFGVLFILFATKDPNWLFVLPILFVLRNFSLRLKLFKTQDTKKLSNIFPPIFFGQNQFDLAFLLCLIFLK